MGASCVLPSVASLTGRSVCIVLVQHIILFFNLPLCCSVYLYQFGKHPTSVHIEIHANPSLILPSP